jgi:hypothetical protein
VQITRSKNKITYIKYQISIVSLLVIVAISSIGSMESIVINNGHVDSTYSTPDTMQCKYWITSTTGRRHNPKCGRYKKTRGYCTEDTIGIACKWCGG